MSGTVIDVKIFSRRIDDPLLEKEHGARIGELRKLERDEIHRVTVARDDELRETLHLNTVALALKKGTVDPFLDEGTKLTQDSLADLDFSQLDLSTLKVKSKDASVENS